MIASSFNFDFFTLRRGGKASAARSCRSPRSRKRRVCPIASQRGERPRHELLNRKLFTAGRDTTNVSASVLQIARDGNRIRWAAGMPSRIFEHWADVIQGRNKKSGWACNHWGRM